MGFSSWHLLCKKGIPKYQSSKSSPMAHSHFTGPGPGSGSSGSGSGSRPGTMDVNIMSLWLIHTAWDRDQDRDWEMMGFYITLCTVHTTQGQGQTQGIIVFCCTHPCPCSGPGPVQCV